MKKVAFITIGQSPRDDIMDEMLPAIGGGIGVTEAGVLDGLDDAAITALAPVGDEDRLVSRLRDGREVIMSKAGMIGRLRELLHRLDGEHFDLLVMLCTGEFEGVSSRTLMVEAQGIVDRTIDALRGEDRHIGIMVPLAAQAQQVRARSGHRSGDRISHASPYSEDRLEAAAGELGDTDLIVMHCLGYTEPMRDAVAKVTGKPVLLARRVVASTVAQLV